MTDETLSPILLRSFQSYVARRSAYYADPEAVLKAILRKDVLLFAVRGVRTVSEFVVQAFVAHESSCEESVWGNTWQEAIASATPNTVGGGDLRMEKERSLWIIQLKMGAQNAGSKAQDLRVLRTKVRSEVDHHPGRKDVRPMYAIIRGKSEFRYVTHTARNAANKDIDGFGYWLAVGDEFLKWIEADFSWTDLITALEEPSTDLQKARRECQQKVTDLLEEELRAAGLAADIFGVMELANRPRRKTARRTNLPSKGTDTATGPR